MMQVRKANVERMMMQESDFIYLEKYMKHLQKEMKKFMNKSKNIAKMADALAKEVGNDKAMKLKKDTKELFNNIADILGNDTPSPSPRFSPKKSLTKSQKRSSSNKKGKSK